MKCENNENAKWRRVDLRATFLDYKCLLRRKPLAFQAGEIFVGVAGRHVKMHSWSPRESFLTNLLTRLGHCRIPRKASGRDLQSMENGSALDMCLLSQDFVRAAEQAIPTPSAGHFAPETLKPLLCSSFSFLLLFLSTFFHLFISLLSVATIIWVIGQLFNRSSSNGGGSR